MSFIIACENGNRKIAELLLQNKEVDVKYTDEKGRTAIPFMQLTYRVAFTFGIAASAGLIAVLPYVDAMLFNPRDESPT